MNKINVVTPAKWFQFRFEAGKYEKKIINPHNNISLEYIHYDQRNNSNKNIIVIVHYMFMIFHILQGKTQIKNKK